MSRRFIRSSIFPVFLGVAIATGLYATSSFNSSIAELAQLEPAAGEETMQQDLVGTFSLIDHDGKPVTEQSFTGQYRLVFFGFTNCPDVCPTGLKKIARALELLGKDGEDIQPLFITVDPARDTPEAMKAYASLFHPRLVGLTGTPAQIKAANDSFKVYAVKQESGDHAHHGYMMDHSAFIYLQDPQGRLVEFFGSDESAESIAGEIRGIIAQG